jgi:3-deoxy-D-manno-octulosonic-acid transferase
LAAYYAPKILLRGKYHLSLKGKLGRLNEDFEPEKLARPRVWFHAVSVGEVVALAPLVREVKALFPTAAIIVSTGTETGQDRARNAIPEADGFLYLPLDFPAFVDPVVQRITPDLFVLMETELWPNLIHSLKSVGASVALANGRISDRSFPRYKALRAFFGPFLETFDLFLMASELDGRRVADMGATQSKIAVTGNTKFDAALSEVPIDAETHIRTAFSLDSATPVLVAGSTHPGEHEIVLDAFRTLQKDFPELILILVPRHVEKTDLILATMTDRQMEPPYLRSSLDLGEQRHNRKVIIVDRTGELFQVFSVASAVYMGGSLVPKGGQNILEPAAWGKMVLFGPSMEDFRDARDILIRSGAGIQVNSAEDLAHRVTEILTDPNEAQERGLRGRKAILEHAGSARRNAQLLVSLISPT